MKQALWVVAYESLKIKEKSIWVIPKVVAVVYGSARLRELFIQEFEWHFKRGFTKVVVTRAGRLREWSQGERQPHFWKAKSVFPSIKSQKEWSSFIIKDYITKLKRFPVVCFCGWQGWKWIEIWKKWANVFHVFMLFLQNSPPRILWLALPDKIHSISSS